MYVELNIRAATEDDATALCELRQQSVAVHGALKNSPSIQSWLARDPLPGITARIVANAQLVGLRGDRLVASAGLDLARREMVGVFVHPDCMGRGFGTAISQAAGKLAAEFCFNQLRVMAAEPIIGFYERLGFQGTSDGQLRTDERTAYPSLPMLRSLEDILDPYARQVHRELERLGIDPWYGADHCLKIQREASELESIGLDIHEREQRLQPVAAQAWTQMRVAASDDGVELQLVSAFRSMAYQAGIVERKLGTGQPMEEILAVSAAPGFSEHHTGRALDLTTPGTEPLEEEFETSRAFQWLTAHAADHGFRLSFPRDNPHGILYEPWHWYYEGP